MSDRTYAVPAILRFRSSGGTPASGEVNRDRLLELERFAAIGRLSAVLLHEISNPLTAAALWLEQCGNHGSPHMSHVRRSVDLMQRYVEAARQQVRQGSGYQNFSVKDELEQTRQVLAPLARRHGIRLHFGPAEGFTLRGDPVKFQQIIANLVRNAMDSYDHCPAGSYKPVCLDLRRRGGHMIMEVVDHGCGIDRKQLQQLFEPFYSTKGGTGRGLGLGLFAVKRSVERDFHGCIRVRSSRRRGTRFIIRIRLA
ncbi:MAG: sensor histidine kinase, partial [Candidatus Saccharimonadales bacterium]